MSVKVDRARVHFKLSEATTYNLSLVDENQLTKDFDAADIDLAGANTAGLVVVNAIASNVVQLKAGPSFNSKDAVEMLIENIDINDVLTITSISSLGTEDASVSLPLVDKVAPTTVLQKSYGIGSSHTGDDLIAQAYGDGGELSKDGKAALGTPYLNITPYLLTPQSGAKSLPLQRSETWRTLTAAFEISNTVNGQLQVDVSNLPVNTVVYDAETIAAWTPGSRTLGVAFSENVTLTGQSPATANFTANLSNFAALNNVTTNDQGEFSDTDLVTVDVDNVMTLAKSDHGEVIDFTASVQDETANTTSIEDNARVIIRDMMPPMPLTAVYNGDNIVVTYNEKVTLDSSADVFTLSGSISEQSFAVDSSNEKANISTSTVTLDLTSSTYNGPATVTRTVESINKLALFNLGKFDHDNDASTASVAKAGGKPISVLSATMVEDAVNGTSWTNWGGTDVDAPVIVITDATGNFGLSKPVVPATLTDNASEFVVTYAFTHRIDLGDLCGVTEGSLVLTPEEVANCFAVNGASGNTVIDASDTPADDGTPSGAILSTNGKNLTVKVNVVNPIPAAVASAANTFGPVNSAISAWDESAEAIEASSADHEVTDLEIPVTPEP